MADERTEAQKQRRKIQNRVNQRARRLRVRDPGDGGKSAKRNQYQTKRWRLDEQENTCVQLEAPVDVSTWLRKDPQDDSQGPGYSDLEALLKQELDAIKCEFLRSAAQVFRLQPSPFQDHLLTLIQFNVLRGIFGNKATLMDSAIYYKTVLRANKLQIEPIKNGYPPRAITFPTSSNIPASLLPTQLQATVEHWTWIDSIPFPRMRDNLIKSEVDYDPAELARDLIGDLIDFSSFYKLQGPTDRDDVKNTRQLPNRDKESTPGRNGLVIWGEPHHPENWEVSPGFLQKWWWTLEGCQDVLDSSNRWRLLRDEEPLSMIN
ncbi:hypothetical protein O988_07859 [Pseudogymnoascus sp. VKM F-3808]|nr:hypothetical protein O988_07859 [Pseudogymnoascus sp. VKM F-3808]